MAIVKCKPTSAGRRHMVKVVTPELHKGAPHAPLLEKKSKTGGRNNDGRITTRHIGGGHKQHYRVIDFKRNKDAIPATVERLEYDPNRTAFIALLEYPDGTKTYILAPQDLKVGDELQSGKGVTPTAGNTMFLGEIPLGSSIHAIELQPGKGAAIARSAGTNGTLMGREGRYASVKLPSGETRLLLLDCYATIGVVSNSDHQLLVSGKAGRSRWLGRRPRTRPVVMNPVDHPMGGGEGKSSGGHPRSRNGIPAKGFRTRSKTKASNKYIVERRKK